MSSNHFFSEKYIVQYPAIDHIINCILDASVKIAKLVNQIPLHLMTADKTTGTKNTHDEHQTSLDISADNLFIDNLKSIPEIYAMVSEEQDQIINCSQDGRYTIAFDPLDGSSNIGYNIPVGSIFGIGYGQDPLTSIPIISGYVLYGPSTILIICAEEIVNGYLYTDQWQKIYHDLKIPQHGNIYSINEGNEKYWSEETKRYIQSLKSSGRYSLRYAGSMVADIHRILLSGGVFYYPSDSKNVNGKLRQLYEINPMSHIISTAGGLSFNPFVECLNCPVTDIHQKSPILIGSPINIQEALSILLL
jgi:fructose-1,6-bisphosphatase I